ncbi:MAG: aromatic amino acid lyase, partial [Flavobacteriaceae bacterium]|nr:aromatic amino acid lyase [Flavobacteriaceae bacterium]
MAESQQGFNYGEDQLSAGLALSLARGHISGKLTPHTRKRVRESAEIVARIVDKGEPVYGINTGFGPLCTTRISKEETRILQTNILKSHSVGVGKPIEKEIAKLMLVLKLHSLAKGYSGIAEETLDRMLWHLENDVTPLVPEQGSVGASGDLAPLSHLFLPLIGLGKVWYKNEVLTTEQLFKKKGITALELGPKEGLALINGTQFIAAHAVKVIARMQRCLSQADIIGAMMVEGLQGSIKPFYTELH